MPLWRWSAATFAILCLWVFGAAVTVLVADAVIPATGAAWQLLATDLVTFIPFFIATPLVWRRTTGAPVARLISETGRIRWQRIAVGFAVWFLLAAAGSALDYIWHRDDYRYTFTWAAFLPFAAVVLLLLPIQCWAEELFFRGWILRWTEARPAAFRVLVSGLVFALPHLGNPEAAGQASLALLAWFLLGAGWAWAAVRDGGIELALGAHLANNTFALLIVGYDDAALPTSAVITTTSLNAAATVLSLLVMVPAFLVLTRRQ